MSRNACRLLVLALVFSGAATAGGEEGVKAVVVESEIYWGDPADLSRPAMVDVDAVYAAIPEYREILDRGMDDSDPRYLFLLRAAGVKFRTALERVARQSGLTVIGGLDSIRIEGREIPIVTDAVIRNLPKR